MTTNLGERVAALEGRLNTHERSVLTELKEIRDDGKRSRNMLVGLLIAALAWAGREVWSTRALTSATAVASVMAATAPQHPK